MFDYIAELYNEFLVVRSTHEVFSLQSVVAFAYVVALIRSIYRAHFNKELFTDFLSIAVVCVKYLLTSLLMERVFVYIAETGNWHSAQNVYLALFAINMLSMYVAYWLHTHLSFKFGLLFLAVIKLTGIVAVSHLIIWFKFVVLNTQEAHEWLHYIYSVTVLSVSILLAIAMLFPNILRTRFGCIIGLNLPRRQE
ncbi:MAG: hypothetical protein CMK63_09905 [Pseudoalteromonadaceae bacterium]|uniref:hypothetical protein n=1 Tax=Pseudoalteromonas shioyasakiensis TaxID=1190813 RepID=UPI000C58E960|nr:hypothetical protein [Pseudoalteromonas shioyasakiensis]MBU77294.1 hypothetical protein [Pseudoalteromonadaceae bacterium]MCZ4253449.1 hypothetical protein [Pseudoalteromonas shioyasakiensis]|tara:strand:+ start:314 stop:898 length:585 start_codon:yes stop_codon:yes gene_type:complete